jgi:RHS repeat-associated protein
LEGKFYWHNESGRHEITGIGCANNIWYDIAFQIHTTYGENVYEIFINGTKVADGRLCGTIGNIDGILFQAGDNDTFPTTQWVDNVRVYKSRDVILNLPAGYRAELHDSNGNVIAKTTGYGINTPISWAFPPGYISVSKTGYFSFETPMMDIWGGDRYEINTGVRSSNLSKTATGFAKYNSSIADESFSPAIKIYSYNPWDGREGRWWGPPYDNPVSGNSYHQSYYSTGTHYHGFNQSSPGMYLRSGDYLIQYISLTEGKAPSEIMVQYYFDGKWHRAYWGGDTNGADTIQMSHSELVPMPDYVARMGNVPQETGRWIQLLVPASTYPWFPNSFVDTRVTGVIYGLYGGEAKWDLTSSDYRSIQVKYLPAGSTVRLKLEDGKIAESQATYGTAYFDLWNIGGYSGVKYYPQACVFEVLYGSTLLYRSPKIPELYNGDSFSYSPPKFYPNNANPDLHSCLVGSLTFQDAAKTVAQESYVKLGYEGDPLESKSNLGSQWVYSQAGYDDYGNQLWSTDATGRATVTEYTSANGYTYPKSMKQGARIDTLDTDNSWARSSDRTWMSCDYSSSRSYSPDRSMKATFSNSGGGGLDFGTARSSKEYAYTGNPVQEISVNLYLESWHHEGVGASHDVMDTGIKMRLYNSGGTNYATYTYWLACWDKDNTTNPNNRSAPDQYTRVVYGICDLPSSTWKNVVLYPSTNWPSIDWASCSIVRFEIYVSTSDAEKDYLTICYDNFAHNDFAKNAKTTNAYHAATGNLLSTTDPLGRTASQQYDILGRVVRANNSDGSYRTTVYDDVNNKVTMSDELGHKTITYFDKIGRMTKVERWGSGTSAYSNVIYTYNWQDKAASFTDERGHVTTYAHDYLGRQTRMTNPDSTYGTVAYNDVNGTVTYCSYTSGNVLTHKTVMVKDLLGRLNATKEYTTSTACNQTLVAYDAVGNVLTVRDARGQVTRMAYDSLNRLTMTTYPDLLYETATYDAAGRTLTKRDREGNTTSSSYGTAGNLVRVASQSDTISRSFDAAGQLMQLKSNLGTISYAYNARGWVKSLTQVIGSHSYQVKFGYDTEGRQTWVQYPNGLNVSYGYDSYDRVTTVTKLPSTALLTITYNLDDSIDSETTGDGTKVTRYAYNNRDWVTCINMKLSGTIKLVLIYSYDDVGNVKQLVVNTTGNANNAKTETYAYDWLDRIKSASGGSLPSGLTYNYDAVGNMLKKGSVTYTYGSYNKLTGDGTWNYAYDPNGNQAWKTKSNQMWNNQWNSLDQLTAVVKRDYISGPKIWISTTFQYWYDANGARAKSFEVTTTTEYVYRGHDPLLENNTGTGVITDYIYVNGRMVAKQTGSNIDYYIKDALGSTRLVYRGTSQVFSVATYAPYGTPVSASGIEKYRFAGELLSGAAGSLPGLYYIGARWMDSELGRWLSLDPELGKLSSPQTMNRYVYCVNNPLKFTDPTGMGFWSGVSKWWDKHWKEVAIVALCVAVVVTAGLAAPALIAGVGAMVGVQITVSATVTVASALVFAGVSAGATYALSGGKASFSQIMGSFVAGGVAGAFLPGIGGMLSKGGAVGAMALGGISGLMGNVYGEAIRNIAGMGAERNFGSSYDPRGTAIDMLFGAGTALLPGGKYLGGKASGIGTPRNYYWQTGGNMEGFFTKAGSLRAIYNPLMPSGRYFYASTAFDAGTAPLIDWLQNLPKYLS